MKSMTKEDREFVEAYQKEAKEYVADSQAFIDYCNKMRAELDARLIILEVNRIKADKILQDALESVG